MLRVDSWVFVRACIFLVRSGKAIYSKRAILIECEGIAVSGANGPLERGKKAPRAQTKIFNLAEEAGMVLEYLRIEEKRATNERTRAGVSESDREVEDQQKQAIVEELLPHIVETIHRAIRCIDELKNPVGVGKLQLYTGTSRLLEVMHLLAQVAIADNLTSNLETCGVSVPWLRHIYRAIMQIMVEVTAAYQAVEDEQPDLYWDDVDLLTLQTELTDIAQEIANAIGGEVVQGKAKIERELQRVQRGVSSGNVREIDAFFLKTAPLDDVVTVLGSVIAIKGRVEPGLGASLKVGVPRWGFAWGKLVRSPKGDVNVINAGDERFVISQTSYDVLPEQIKLAILWNLKSRHALIEEEVIDDTFREIMERLCDVNPEVMLQGLGARIESVSAREFQRMQQVFAAFRPYVEGRALPPGTSPDIMRFLVVSAGVPKIWQEMDEQDRRIGDARNTP